MVSDGSEKGLLTMSSSPERDPLVSIIKFSVLPRTSLELFIIRRIFKKINQQEVQSPYIPTPQPPPHQIPLVLTSYVSVVQR